MLAGALVTRGLAQRFTAGAAQGSFNRGAQADCLEIGVGQSEWDAAALDALSSAGGALTATSLDKSGTPWGINAGIQLMQFFAIEAAYDDFGKASAQGTVPTGTGAAPLGPWGSCRSVTARSTVASLAITARPKRPSAPASGVSRSASASRRGPPGVRGIPSR